MPFIINKEVTATSRIQNNCNKYLLYRNLCGTYGWYGRCYVEKTLGQRPLGRPRSKWENNIKTDRKYIVWEGVDLIWLRMSTSDDELLWTGARDFRFHNHTGTFLTSWGTLLHELRLSNSVSSVFFVRFTPSARHAHNFLLYSYLPSLY